MHLVVSVDDTVSSPGPVEYRWDADTDILTASLPTPAPGTGMTGSVEIGGGDGSWIVLDVHSGRIVSIEIAVWPDVKIAESLEAPLDVTDAAISIPVRASQPGVAAIELDTRVAAVATPDERTIHFKVGAARPSRAVRAACDILLELDDTRQIAGIWMLNVPPFPGAS